MLDNDILRTLLEFGGFSALVFVAGIIVQIVFRKQFYDKDDGGDRNNQNNNSKKTSRPKILHVVSIIFIIIGGIFFIILAILQTIHQVSTLPDPKAELYPDPTDRPWYAYSVDSGEPVDEVFSVLKDGERIIQPKKQNGKFIRPNKPGRTAVVFPNVENTPSSIQLNQSLPGSRIIEINRITENARQLLGELSIDELYQQIGHYFKQTEKPDVTIITGYKKRDEKWEELKDIGAGVYTQHIYIDKIKHFIDVKIDNMNPSESKEGNRYINCYIRLRNNNNVFYPDREERPTIKEINRKSWTAFNFGRVVAYIKLGSINIREGAASYICLAHYN